MRLEKHPLTYTFSERFPDARVIRVWTGSKLYATERDEKFYLIMDDGSILDAMPESEAAQAAVKIFEFDTDDEREAFLLEKYPYSILTDPNLSFEDRMAGWEAEIEQQLQAKRKRKFCEG